MNQVFTYPLFYKIIYRYGNIPATLILFFYFFVAAANFNWEAIKIIYLIILPLLIYYLNKIYFKNYKSIPYKIESDNEKLICSDFIFSEKKVIIIIEDIVQIKGGIFEQKLSGAVTLKDNKNNCVAFFSKIKNYKFLLFIILNKIDKNLYSSISERLQLNKFIPQ